MRRIYIAGKISGLPLGLARAQFEQAAELINNNGDIAVSPLGEGWLGEGASWQQHMKRDIALLLTCNAIYMLSGWTSSEGARLEHYIARTLGVQVIYQAEPCIEKGLF